MAAQNTILIEVVAGCVVGVYADSPDLVDIVIADHDVAEADGGDPHIEFSRAEPMASAEKETLRAVAEGRDKTLMMTVRLKTREGGHVADKEMPLFQTLPEAVVWGSRTFGFRSFADDGAAEYFEVFCYTVVDIPVADSVEEPAP